MHNKGRRGIHRPSQPVAQINTEGSAGVASLGGVGKLLSERASLKLAACRARGERGGEEE